MPQNLTIKSLLSASTTKLKGILTDESSAFFEVNLLLQHVLGVNRAWLISHENDVLSVEKETEFTALFSQRLAGEPIAYIVGQREFYGLNLKVTPDTLIPRPDTETLVEAALERIPPNRLLTVLDLGTGSGAIALAIAKNRPQTQVTAVDASSSALSIAQENAHLLQISNVQFLPSNWFESLAGKTFDMIVSNPPYIASADPHLSQGDLRFEPASALASGEDGLNDIRLIVQQATHYLNPNGWLMLEHGYNQADEVAKLLTEAEFIAVQHVQDLAGIVRVTLGQLPSPLNAR
jgi:release factor glutamine methyltransferase